MTVPTVECPAGICKKTTATFDHDNMFGHLLLKHNWTFDTTNDWCVENMASDEEARELESRFDTKGEQG